MGTISDQKLTWVRCKSPCFIVASISERIPSTSNFVTFWRRDVVKFLLLNSITPKILRRKVSPDLLALGQLHTQL